MNRSNFRSCLLKSFEPEIIIGPPGTGKTTYLLSEVERSIATGTSPESIGYVAFTKKAATEAIERASEKFGLSEKNMPYFRTLHSLAFRMLGVTRSQVLNKDSLKEFGQLMGLSFTGVVNISEGTAYGSTEGDRAMFIAALARIRCMDLKDQWNENNEDVGWWAVERVARGLKEFKESNGLIDFTDMLERYVDDGYAPELDLLVVDEAQDLSQLQWRMVIRLAERAKRVIVAGDDDQAIFRWAGADVPYFIALKGPTTVLEKSYRVPQPVQDWAAGIISGVPVRRPKTWTAREGDGEVSFHASCDTVDMSEGSWLVLARNLYLLDDAEEQCRREGFYYAKGLRRSVSEKTLRTIRAWERLRKGEQVSDKEARDILAVVSHERKGLPKDGYFSMSDLVDNWAVIDKGIWHESFDKMALVERAYLIAMLRRGEKITKHPRIGLSTIHGAKGGEADNVVLYTDMARRSYMEMVRRPEDEHRVFYVGATRTRTNLHVVMPRSKYYFATL